MSTSKPKGESSLPIADKKDSKKDVDKKSKPVKKNQSQLIGDISPPLLLSSEPLVSATLDIQFGHFEKLFQNNNHDPNDNLIIWPKNDVIVEEQPRKTRTGAPVLPVC